MNNFLCFVFFHEILLSHFEGLTSKLRLDTRSDDKLLFISLKSVQVLRPGNVERIEGVVMQEYLFNTVQPQLTLELYLNVYTNLTKYT